MTPVPVGPLPPSATVTGNVRFTARAASTGSHAAARVAAATTTIAATTGAGRSR